MDIVIALNGDEVTFVDMGGEILAVPCGLDAEDGIAIEAELLEDGPVVLGIVGGIVIVFVAMECMIGVVEPHIPQYFLQYI